MGSVHHHRVRARLGLITLLLTLPAVASAKEYGVRTPSGRKVYKSNETFSDALDQDTRRFIVEVATGAGPEGNLAMLFGWIPEELGNLELYAGFGFELNPALHYTAATRLFFKIGDARPYIGAGYLFSNLTALGTYSHNVFAEIGHRWKIHHTFRLTLSLGLRRVVSVGVHPTSVLAEGDIDPALLDRELDDIPRWLPLIALRLSRAF
jgi:hypothetical protein